MQSEPSTNTLLQKMSSFLGIIIICDIYQLNVPLNALWKAEQKSESLKYIKCIPSSVSIIFTTQYILKQTLSIFACTCSKHYGIVTVSFKLEVLVFGKIWGALALS